MATRTVSNAHEDFNDITANPTGVVVSVQVNDQPRIPVRVVHAPRSPQYWLIEERFVEYDGQGGHPEVWRFADRVAFCRVRCHQSFADAKQQVTTGWTQGEQAWLSFIARDRTFSFKEMLNDQELFNNMLDLHQAFNGNAHQMATGVAIMARLQHEMEVTAMPLCLTFAEALRRVTHYRYYAQRHFRITNVITGEVNCVSDYVC